MAGATNYKWVFMILSGSILDSCIISKMFVEYFMVIRICFRLYNLDRPSLAFPLLCLTQRLALTDANVDMKMFGQDIDKIRRRENNRRVIIGD